ncbi:MAG: hypothetical protein JWS12_276, partial [Candidatus Saccharibacteria bacterium]|nr:hypothetical protein [Candidatus Saccharibacteria bacterium]
MQAYILLGVLLGVPLLLGLIFRVGTAQLFLSLLAGDVLQRYFKDEALKRLTPLVHNSAILQYVGLVILVLPLVLTAVFMRHTLSKSKTLLHLLPLIITGTIFAAFAVPLLPDSLRGQLASNAAGRMLNDSTNTIIGAMVGLQLVTMWIFNRSK